MSNNERNIDVVISSRVRLARNLADFPFPGRMSREQYEQVCDAVADALSGAAASFKVTRMNDLSPAEARAMAERHLVSPEFAQAEHPRAAAITSDGSVCIMINEEDHLRIQALGAGLCLQQCLENAFRADDLIEARLRFAFDEKLGYLTHCPTNLGTGMRASVMMHLPALTETGEIRRLTNAVGKLGFTVRGIYGEGSAATGAIYQVSNQVSLGLSEREICDRLEKAVAGIIDREKELRKQLRENSPLLFEDRVMRALGTLSYARLLSSGEATQLITALRLGAAEGCIENLGIPELDSLLWDIQPNNVAAAGAGNERERDAKRAELVRSVVKKAAL